ncbi:MAG: TonB-dependent receptor [FCB group bacterium]|nr:TonB-dependent receptor [FCB group bacterium]
MRTKYVTYFIYSTIIFILFCQPIDANGVLNSVDINRGTIQGQVTDVKGNPLVSANVIIPSLETGTSTDKKGHFILKDLPATELRIQFGFVGYKSEIRKVNLFSRPNVVLNIKLKTTAIEANGIIVTGSPLAINIQKSPKDIQVMCQSDLQRLSSASLGKTLEYIPGISNISTGPQVGKPVLRGLSGSRVLVMKDGIPMEYFQFSSRHMPVLNLSQAQRVEVVRGSASILYGSDALGGAVNVIDKPIPNPISGKGFLKGTFHSQYFSNNNERSGGVDIEGFANGLGYRIGISDRLGDDFHTPDEKTYAETKEIGAPKFTGKIPYTNFRQSSGFAQIGTHGNFGNAQIIYDRWINKQNYLLPDGNPLGQFLKNDNLKSRGNFFLGKKLIFKPTLSFQRNHRQVAANHTYEGHPNWDVDLLRTVYVARLELLHTNIKKFNGTMGIEANYQAQNTKKSGLEPNAHIFNFASFLFEELPLNRLTLNAGIRLDLRHQKAKKNEAIKLPDYQNGETDNVLTQDYSEMSGSIGYNYQLTDYLSFSNNFGAGFRAPNIFELHAYGIHAGVAAFQIGNPYLKPERSYDLDFSLKLHAENIMTKATLYRNEINNYIYLRNQGMDTTINPTLPIYSSDQTDGTIWGLELSSTINIFSWLQGSINYSTLSSNNKATGAELPLMPADKINGYFKLSHKNLSVIKNPFIQIEYKYVFDKKSAGVYEPFSQFDTTPFGTASTKDYTVINISFGGTLFLDNHPVNVYLRIDNLLNNTYRDFLDTYKGYALSPGRNIVFKLSLPFSII